VEGTNINHFLIVVWLLTKSTENICCYLNILITSLEHAHVYRFWFRT